MLLELNEAVRSERGEEDLSIITVASKETMGELKCYNISKHNIVTGNGKMRSFNADAEEFNYWERVPRQKRDNMRREYLKSDECLLCIIDKFMQGKL